MGRWTCHALVGAWGLLLLIQPTATLPTVPVAEPEARATVKPVALEPPQEPATPGPDPATRSDPPAERGLARREEPGLRRIEATDLASGGALLDGGGGFPILSFDYDDFRSFRAYARAMARLGARFVVVRSREIVGTVDLESGALGRFGGGAFSPRARDYTGEPGLAQLTTAARESYGDRAVVMMLVPRSLDAGLFGGLARLLAERGEPHTVLREIRGRYVRSPGGGIRLQLEGAVRRDGTLVPIDAVFDLTQIAAAANA